MAKALVSILGIGRTLTLKPPPQSAARDIFIEKHAATGNGKERWLAGNFLYFRMDKVRQGDGVCVFRVW